VSGYDKKIETWILQNNFLNLTEFEQNLTKQLDLDQFETQSMQHTQKQESASYEIDGYETQEA